MSTGFFMGVRSSFREGTAPAAEAFLAAINQALSQNGSQPYRDPLQPPDVYNDSLFGRSELDNCSSETLAEVACLGSQSSTSTNLSLICDNPYRTCFIPAYLGIPIPTIYQERIGSQTITIWIGSLSNLFREVTKLAAILGIPMQSDGLLADQTAEAINREDQFLAKDSQSDVDRRQAWLCLYESVRLALAHGAALTLAG